LLGCSFHVTHPALVQYSLADKDLLYIWVMKPNGAIAFKTVNLKDNLRPINDLITHSRQAIGVRAAIKISSTSGVSREDSTLRDLRDLYKILIEPIAAELPNDPNQRVIFIPQGELFLVPFPALKNAQGKYLIEQHTISSAPSIQTLNLTRKQRTVLPRANTIPLIVGNPIMPRLKGETLLPLPGAEKEALTIAQLFNTTALIGGEATKSTVLNRMKSASIIHLATHGLLNIENTGKDEIPGAIALAPSPKDNGLLTSKEIFDLKLNTNLVVLSACDTGRGKITGDGVVGLSRSFMAAGVPSIVVSLWAVNDSSTSVFMGEFYRNLKTTPNKAVALRQAMLTTMQQYPNPSDWAAFSLVGEAE
jgi:CHAT domain-containing protein